LAALQQQLEEIQAVTESSPPPAAAASAAASAAAGDGGSSSEGDEAAGGRKREVLADDHPFANVAVWQLAPAPLFFEGPRAAAKELAKLVVAEAAAGAGRK
jgi:hypothetical protein